MFKVWQALEVWEVLRDSNGMTASELGTRMGYNCSSQLWRMRKRGNVVSVGKSRSRGMRWYATAQRPTNWWATNPKASANFAVGWTKERMAKANAIRLAKIARGEVIARRKAKKKAEPVLLEHVWPSPIATLVGIGQPARAVLKFSREDAPDENASEEAA